MDNFDVLVQSLGEATGIENLKPDDEGVVRLAFDQDITVFIQPDWQHRYVSLYCVVALVGETVPGPLMLELLSASLFGREANGGTFAIEESMGQIVLQRSERLDGLSYADFEPILRDFVDSAEAWILRLSPDTSERAVLVPFSESDRSALKV